MNRDLLDALAALVGHYYSDALERHPGLLADPAAAVGDEDLLVWHVLMVLDELSLAIAAAQDFDDVRSRPDPPEPPPQEDLPF